MITRFALICLLTVASLSFAGLPAAEPESKNAGAGTGVQLQWWGQALVTIKFPNQLTVAIDPYAEDLGYGKPDIKADIVLVTHEHFDHNNVTLVQGKPQVIRGLENKQATAQKWWLVPANKTGQPPMLDTYGDSLPPTAISITEIPAFHDAKQGGERGQNTMFLLEDEGVRILHCGDFGELKLSEQQIDDIGHIDLLLVPVGGKYTVDGPAAAGLVAQLKPRLVIPIHYRTPALHLPAGNEKGLATVDAFLNALPKSYERETPATNTFAIPPAEAGTTIKVIILPYKP